MSQPVDWLNWSLPVPLWHSGNKSKTRDTGRPQRRCHPPLTGDEDDDDDYDDDDEDGDGDGDDDTDD